MQIIQAIEPPHIAIVRELMREYQQALGVDLCFQNFEAELRNLPGSYAPPTGRLLLAIHDDSPVGCVALQAIDTTRCEMKRLYVRPSARGLGVGRALIAQVLEAAQNIGYAEIVLDTLPTMIEAQRLYEQFGFSDIASYRPNPIGGTRYLGKRL
jgi:putative acetyltransferase